MVEKIVASAVVAFLVIASRVIFGRVLARQSRTPVEERRSHIVLLRNITLLTGSLLLILIWADELQVLGLSLVAFGVAIAISLQDVVKSAIGAAVRATSSTYTVGDRIKIGDIRGQVIDHSLLTTTLIEIGPGSTRTGRTITIPNSLPLTEPLLNETAGHEYVLHSFAVLVKRTSWRTAEQVLLAAAQENAGPYVDPARNQMEERARTHALSAPNVVPLVFLRSVDVDVVELTVRVPVAAGSAGAVEDAIVRTWLAHGDETDAHPAQ